MHGPSIRGMASRGLLLLSGVRHGEELRIEQGLVDARWILDSYVAYCVAVRRIAAK